MSGRSLVASVLFVAAATLAAVPAASTLLDRHDGEAASSGLPASQTAATPGRTPAELPTGGQPTSWCDPSPGGYVCMAGPFEVRPGRRLRVTMPVEPPPMAGYITSARASLVDARGFPVPAHLVHFHHAVWLNPNREDTTCERFGGFPVNPERFFGSGQERTPLALPPGYGYHWDNEPAPWIGRPTWYLNADLDGHHGEPNTFVELRLGFTPDAAAPEAGMVGITPVWLDVRNCEGDVSWTVPRGSGNAAGVASETWTFELPVGGRFVALGGHLHDGGLRIALRNLSTGRMLFTSRALYQGNDPWRLSGMTAFSGLPGKPVAAGQKLRLTAFYDSTHGRHDVMGIMLGALAPA